VRNQRRISPVPFRRAHLVPDASRACAKHLGRFTLDSSGKVLFNHSVGSLHRDIPFQKAFDYVQYAVERRVSNPLRMVWKRV